MQFYIGYVSKCMQLLPVCHDLLCTKELNVNIHRQYELIVPF